MSTNPDPTLSADSFVPTATGWSTYVTPIITAYQQTSKPAAWETTLRAANLTVETVCNDIIGSLVTSNAMEGWTSAFPLDMMVDSTSRNLIDPTKAWLAPSLGTTTSDRNWIQVYEFTAVNLKGKDTTVYPVGGGTTILVSQCVSTVAELIDLGQISLTQKAYGIPFKFEKYSSTKTEGAMFGHLLVTPNTMSVTVSTPVYLPSKTGSSPPSAAYFCPITQISSVSFQRYVGKALYIPLLLTFFISQRIGITGGTPIQSSNIYGYRTAVFTPPAIFTVPETTHTYIQSQLSSKAQGIADLQLSLSDTQIANPPFPSLTYTPIPSSGPLPPPTPAPAARTSGLSTSDIISIVLLVLAIVIAMVGIGILITRFHRSSSKPTATTQRTYQRIRS